MEKIRKRESIKLLLAVVFLGLFMFLSNDLAYNYDQRNVYA